MGKFQVVEGQQIYGNSWHLWRMRREKVASRVVRVDYSREMCFDHDLAMVNCI